MANNYCSCVHIFFHSDNFFDQTQTFLKYNFHFSEHIPKYRLDKRCGQKVKIEIKK